MCRVVRLLPARSSCGPLILLTSSVVYFAIHQPSIPFTGSIRKPAACRTFLLRGPQRSMRKSEMLRKATQTKSTPKEYHPLKVDLIGCQVFFLPRQHVSVAHQFTPDGGTGRKQPKHAEKYRFYRKTGTAASVRGKIDCNKMRALLREGHLEAMFYLRTHTHKETVINAACGGVLKGKEEHERSLKV